MVLVYPDYETLSVERKYLFLQRHLLDLFLKCWIYFYVESNNIPMCGDILRLKRNGMEALNVCFGTALVNLLFAPLPFVSSTDQHARFPHPLLLPPPPPPPPSLPHSPIFRVLYLNRVYNFILCLEQGHPRKYSTPFLPPQPHISLISFAFVEMRETQSYVRYNFLIRNAFPVLNRVKNYSTFS